VIFPVVNNLARSSVRFLENPNYLVHMDKRYVTLQTLAKIVRETPHPTQYLCTPREMILHSVFDWELINSHLSSLEKEELVVIVQADTLQFYITQKGLDKINSNDHPEEDKIQLLIRQETIIH
jgi:predicted transcriptional regulator